ncbi:MAG: hypothetical protein PHF84_06150, partial [bacterium]|nr:hypothetical protein [bacterium]
MIKIIIIILLLTTSGQAKVLFNDDFTDTGKISYRTNIRISGSSAIVSNVLSGLSWPLSTVAITKKSNETWDVLNLSYAITNQLPLPATIPDITVFVLDSSRNILNGAGQKFRKTSGTSMDLKLISNLMLHNTILLRMMLYCGSGNIGTPVLNSYEIIVTESETNVSYTPKNVSFSFYAAPAPLRLDESSMTRFYCRFTKSCTATLKIYDTNYNLVRNVLANKSFSGDSDLDAVW